MINLIKKFKVFILGLFIIPIAFAATSLDKEVIDKEVITLDSKILTEITAQKILPVFKKETIDNQDIEYHHYKTPKGDMGYQVIVTKEEDNKIYKKSYDPTGVELEKYRYYDWKIIQDNITASSSVNILIAK